MKFHTANGFFACTTPLAALFVASITGCPVPPEEEEGSTFVGSETAATDTETDSAGSTDASSSDTGEEASCGNGKIDDDEGEECDLGSGNTDNGLCTSACKLGVCGDGLLLLGQEQCDDANNDDADGCAACKLPSCGDGILNGPETGLDCGGGCAPCVVGQGCMSASDCATGACEMQICGYAKSCAEIHDEAPGLSTGVYAIDPDGVGLAFDVWCEMVEDGGGWTLVMVSSDDGQDTWTYDARDNMTVDTTSIGSLSRVDMDFKSRAYHGVKMSNVRFAHAPSGVAVTYQLYEDGEEPQALATFVDEKNEIECTLDSGGFASAAEFTLAGICSTGKLYVNLGNLADGCSDPNNLSNVGAGFGPTWHVKVEGSNCADAYNGSLASLGPVNVVDMEDKESTAVGFGEALDLNWGTPGAAENYMQVYVR